MKKLVVTVCVLSVALLSFGQQVDKSRLQVNAGVGLSTWGFPVYLGADYWVNQDITVGLEASFRFGFNHYTRIGGLVNANYHVNRLLELPEQFDVYGGISIGPFISLYRYSSPSFYLGAGLQIGGRYYINDKLAFNVEVGGGTLTGGKAGITFRF
ncbi:MAG: hypothetical protein M0P69_08345 [Bacteroidales bacterium]|jgi:hypothetical protein|nr:hypothetical protein [Bacteroidales bacterium]MDD2570582.1 hypothetical protein [Bacteroidales bacterium]MDD2813294.1 hypothetical protein [Bacteroidales bacterium]MDD3385210.1 hypothetical protein [Bacteroidales bacterium]MDD3871885.1 hypothetical protein [Bacteroidales bacterium]